MDSVPYKGKLWHVSPVLGYVRPKPHTHFPHISSFGPHHALARQVACLIEHNSVPRGSETCPPLQPSVSFGAPSAPPGAPQALLVVSI